MRPGRLFAALGLALATSHAGAIDLDEFKRLARLQATQDAQQEAAEQEKLRAAAELPANRQSRARPATVLSGTASQMEKLAKGIEEAHAAAPNRWYQAAKIEDITPPGDDQRKIYKVTGLLTSFCIRYQDKNRGDQGKANLGDPLIGACPHMF
ncbi:hypothetical protein [Massilia sp. DWR3-1-1]|uniref:hypothetical protein n=1 Tax=Massilia sp. DWR3-1-1 TaxID=2804559 RepID=UPI003CE9C713